MLLDLTACLVFLAVIVAAVVIVRRNVTGLTRMTCPECGHDLRTAGILTQSNPQGANTAAEAMKFTLLLGFIAVIATAGVESVVPVRHSYQRQVQLGPLSAGYRNVLVQTNRSNWGGNFTPGEVTLELEPASGTPAAPLPRLTVHADGGFELTTAGSKVLGPAKFDDGAVLEWLKAAGIDTTAEDIRQKAARIAAEARIAAHSGRAALQWSSGSGFMSRSSSGGGSTDAFQSRSANELGESHSPVTPLIAIVVFWIAVWMWGLWYLAKSRIRRRNIPTRVKV